MRTLPVGFLSDVENSRSISARLTFRDNRLVFTERVLADSLGLADPSTADAAPSGTGILRVVNYSNALYTQDITDPSSILYPDWADASISLAVSSRPGVEGDRIWYQDSIGDIYYWDYPSGSPVLVTSSYAAYTVTLAPVSTSVCYIHFLDQGWGRIVRLTSAGAETEWQGRIYGNVVTAQYFDAVTLNGEDHLYAADQNDGRLLTLKYYEGIWSDTSYVIPLDVVDETSYFRMAYASVIDGKVVITGRLSRQTEYDVPVAFDIYTFGPDHYTMGRDLFVSQEDIGGKMFLIDSMLFYVGINTVSEADATMLVGYDHPDHKVVVNDLHSWSLGCAGNTSGQFSASLARSEEDAMIRRNAEALLEININGAWATMATVSLDTVTATDDMDRQELLLSGRSSAIKKLSMWESDQNYDYWSQAKLSAHPGELENVIRVTGLWDEADAGPLELEDLNVDGVLYMSAKASRGGLMRAKFQKPTADDFSPLYGVALNYYYNTEAEIGHNGLLAIWGDDQHSGGAGIGLYYWDDGVMTLLTSASLSIPDDTWHWLMMTFQDGLIRVFYRLDSTTTWTSVISMVFDEEDYLPWKREAFGRGGLYIRNRTPYSMTPGFSSNSMILPVESTASFPTSETVVVNQEKITYDGILSGTPIPGDLIYDPDGYTATRATHNNSYFDGSEIVARDGAYIPADRNLNSSASYLFGPSWKQTGLTMVTEIKFLLKRNGSPPPLYCYLVHDHYDNQAPQQQYVRSWGSVSYSSVGTSYSWVTFTITNPVWTSPTGYFAMLTMRNPSTGAHPGYDASNYWTVQIDNNNLERPGVIRAYNNGWYTVEGIAVPFQVLGRNRTGTGYEIYLDGRGSPCERDTYNNFSLVVTDGPGKGSVFTVTDYDWQAPNQWVPNQEYEAPEKWQDYAGLSGHGSWATSNLSRIFVQENPSGIIGAGTVFRMWPSLLVSERGVDGTLSTSHGETEVSVYRDASVQTDLVQFYSTEPDMMMEDIIRELGTKAGVQDFEFDQALETAVSSTAGTWGAPSYLPGRKNFIARFNAPTLSSSQEVGVICRATAQEPAIADLDQGYMITLTWENKLRFYINTLGTWIMLEEFAPGFSFAGEVRISGQDDAFSVWVSGRYAYTFHDATWADGEYAGMIVYGAATVTPNWSDLDRRKDNYIFDMGQRGAQLLADMIGQRRIYYHDSQTGALKVFRSRPAAYDVGDVLIASNDIQSDGAAASRVRAEGYNVAEYVDYDLLREEGNLFKLINAMEANDAWESYEEARKVLLEAASRTSNYAPVGFADPRIEPNDQIVLSLPDGDVSVIVDEVQFGMDIASDRVTFDMEIGARDAEGS
nr:hypothetical protein [Anaerolineae bacterium]